MLKKTLIAGTALLAVAGTTLAYAQSGDRGDRPQRPQFTAEDRAAFADARIAGIKAALKLTPEQEKNWPAVEKAARDLLAQRAKQREARRDKNPRDLDPVERMRYHATTMGERADGLKKLADAAEPLYKSLDDAQKKRLTFLMRRGPGFGKHGHHGWHGRHFSRWSGEDGDAGPGRGPGMGPGHRGPGMGPGGSGNL